MNRRVLAALVTNALGLAVLQALTGPGAVVRDLAYIDPGLGAMATQIVLGAFLGIAFYFRRIRSRVTEAASQLLGRKQDDPTE